MMEETILIELRGDDEVLITHVETVPRKGETVITPFGHTMRVIDVVHAIPCAMTADDRVVGSPDGLRRIIVQLWPV